jgi:hypothetical protein
MNPRIPRASSLSIVACAAVALWLTTSAAHAVEPQYRQMKLVDGRVLSAEILATEAQGLRVHTPQGEMLVSFELLLDMVPISQAQYESQAKWVVYYDFPDEFRAEALELLAAIPGVEPQAVDTPGNGVGSEAAFKAASCEQDVECMAAAVSRSSWKWVVAARPADTGGWVMSAKLNTATDPAEQIVLDGTGRAELWPGLHRALGLDPPSGGPPRATNDPPPEAGSRELTEKGVVSLSFVPVPGLPSLLQKDWAGVAMGVGIAVPASVVWGAGLNQSAQTEGEFWGLWAGGTYAAIVLANQVTGLRSLEKHKVVVSGLPSERGAMLVVGGELR